MEAKLEKLPQRLHSQPEFGLTYYCKHFIITCEATQETVERYSSEFASMMQFRLYTLKVLQGSKVLQEIQGTVDELCETFNEIILMTYINLSNND